MADALSRSNLTLFRSVHPKAHQEPVAIPMAALDLILLHEPEWIPKDRIDKWASTLTVL